MKASFHRNMHIPVHTHTHARARAHTHTHTHTRIHIDMHICIRCVCKCMCKCIWLGEYMDISYMDERIHGRMKHGYILYCMYVFTYVYV